MTAITGIILCGGKSSRMGADKGLLSIGGKAMIAHVIEALKPLCSEILLVTSNKDYEQFGYSLVPDNTENFGPVAGVLSGLNASKNDLNLVLSCDVPFVLTALLKQLTEQIGSHDAIAASSADGVHPLVGAYRKRCTEYFELAVRSEEHRLRTVFERLFSTTLLVSSDEMDQLKNFNEPRDLDR